MTPEYEVIFTDGTKDRVKAYNVEFHDTHVAFSNTTLVKAFRSDSVASIERLW
jgi:hypothetical protein